ncbi:MAG: hypothetical protein E6J90_41425 [Deltaproteobacteria bacterium]|nr:MAG: hypothetical protein E6J90_41425 [Deltaproteobacteria bacterium]
MTDHAALALEAARRLRHSAAFRGLTRGEQETLGRDLVQIERALAGPQRDRYGGDPYAIAQATPGDLQRDLAGSSGGAPARSSSGGQPGAAPAVAPPAAPPPAPAKNPLADMKAAGEIVDAINFPSFVASLVTGTFKAIVDATAQQLREYADLVANLSRSVDDFGREHVSDDQVRANLAGKYPTDLVHKAPPPGQAGATRLELAAGADGTSPAWLAQYGLGGQPLDADLVTGPLVEAGRTRLAEERMQTLAAMVLMGINRIVINDGDIQAKLQFHAQVNTKTDVELATAQVNDGSIAQRSIGGAAAPTLMVSTAKVNAQSDASAKANLTGQVRIRFRSETFPLERFADTAAIQLINRHAQWNAPGAPAAGVPAAGVPAAGAPAGPAAVSAPPAGPTGGKP